MARLESGAYEKLESEIEAIAADELEADLELTIQQHAPGSHGLGVESVIVEVICDASHDGLQETVLDRAEHEFVGGGGGLIHRTIQETHDELQDYGGAHDYNVQPVEDSFSGVDVARQGDTLTIGFGWTHDAVAYFERGVSEHTIEGQPLLSFIWENPPRWAEENFEPEAGGVRVFLPEVEHPGLPEGRFVRSGINWLRREVS